MPGIVALVSAISTDVAGRLAAQGIPPLTDGKILLGRQHVLEQSAPPRIVFVPMTSRFGPRDTYNASRISGFPSSEILLQWSQRAIHNDAVLFEVHCWGAASPPSPDGDFDVTQVLYQTVIASIRTNITGGYTLFPGTWADQQPTAAQLQKLGHEFVFGLEINTPILDPALAIVPVSSVQAMVEFAGNSAEAIIILKP
jgi:hypothetical protein